MTDTSPTRPFTAAAFDLYLAEHKLMASHCTACGATHLPPRAICPSCHSEQIEWIETSGKGTLAGFTVIYVAPTFMVEQGYGREKPYVSGIIELEEGLKISAYITGVDAARPETVRIGARLQVDFIELGAGDQKRTCLAFKAI